MSSTETSAPSEVRVAGEVNRMIQVEVGAIYGRLENLRQQSRFPSFDSVNIPMVLVLGNHSSGKSTFINHMLGQEVQKTGRAPTDCTFTVMVGGQREERLDGSALVRHAKYGFSDVQRLFGRGFVSQIELKVIEKSKILDDGGLMIVDSPGMIDPPGASADRTDMDRGYDFKRVVQWFADRADVILVMFDPDKPGTTFETLDVLTTSLRDMTSKVLLILNKVDDFKTVHDFARAYGALCWNLSKVIPRKDLPYIYTMYVPQDKRDAIKQSAATENSKKKSKGKGKKKEILQQTEVAAPPSPSSDFSDTETTSNSFSTSESVIDVQAMLTKEFDGTRGEVIREVERSPDRATDNILNLLKNTASKLKMHCSLLEACKDEYDSLDTFWRRVRIAGVAAGVGIVTLYLIRTVGTRKVIDPEKLVPSRETATTITTSTTTSSSSSGTTSSSSNDASTTAASTASKPATSTTAPTTTSTPKWKKNWAKQVQKSQSQFSYFTLFKILASSCAANLSLWKASILSLEKKRDTVLSWLPATFQRIYAANLCKTDRTHDETIIRWNAVRPGLELALSSAPLDDFPKFELADKSYLDDVLTMHIPRLDRCVRDRTGDDHAYLRFKHLDKPSARTSVKQDTENSTQ